MKIIIRTLIVTFSTTFGFAQELRSSYFMETSMFRHQMNPALLEKPYAAIPLLGNINIGTSGKNGLSTFVYPLENGQHSTTSFMSPEVDSQEFFKKIKNKADFNANLNLNVLSVAFNAFNGTNLVEVNLRSNTYSTFPHHLFVFMKVPNSKKYYNFDKMGITSETYAELVLGHSRKLSKRFSIGGKVKVLVGGSYAQFKVNHLNATLSGDEWIINGDTEAVAAVFDSRFKYSSEANGRKVVGLTDPSFALPGLGAAFDMGIAYKTRFIDGLTLSAAVTDLGYMVWKNANTAASNGRWIFDGFKDITQYDISAGVKTSKQLTYIKNDVVKMLAFDDQGQKNVGRMLASTINLGLNYVIPSYERLHFGALFSHRFNGLHSFSQMMFSANIHPTDWFEVCLNTTTTSNGLNFGGMVSFTTKRFNVYLGTDRFFSKLSEDFIPVNSFNANVNFGMTIPLERRYR